MCGTVLRTTTEEVDDDTDYFEQEYRNGWVIDESPESGHVVTPVQVWRYKHHEHDGEWTDVETVRAGHAMEMYDRELTYTDHEELDGYTHVVYFDRDTAYDRAIALQNEMITDYTKGLNELRKRKRGRD